MKKRLLISLLVLLLVAAMGVNAFAEGGVPQEGSRGILYRVTDGDTVIYLFGSIHIGVPEMYPFDASVMEAMAQSDWFVYECDTESPQAAANMLARMKLPQGEMLQQHIGDELYWLLQQVCEKAGLNIRTFDSLKPWVVINTLAVYATAAEMGAAYVEDAKDWGVEKQVRLFEKAHSKQTTYLETLDEQLDVLEGFSEALQRYLLQSECQVILDPTSVQGMESSIADWPAWWAQGDQEAFAQSYYSSYKAAGYEAESEEYHTRLVTERNLIMADRLEALLAEGKNCFATIGLLHLALPGDSVAEHLQNRGYTVELVSRP